MEDSRNERSQHTPPPAEIQISFSILGRLGVTKDWGLVGFWVGGSILFAPGLFFQGTLDNKFDLITLEIGLCI